MKSWPVAHLPFCINANTKEWQVRMGDAGACIHRGVSSCPRMAVKTAVELDSSGVSYFCPVLRYLTKAAEGRKDLFDSHLEGAVHHGGDGVAAGAGGSCSHRIHSEATER